MRDTHIFVLPAARIHVVSVLRSMAYGQAVVVSDGWGFGEYVEHGRNGLIVPGRYGKVSWTDPATGMLREDYEPMWRSDSAVVDGLVEAVDASGERYGEARLLDVLGRHRAEPVQDILAKVLAEADAWAQSPADDRTLLILRI